MTHGCTPEERERLDSLEKAYRDGTISEETVHPKLTMWLRARGMQTEQDRGLWGAPSPESRPPSVEELFQRLRVCWSPEVADLDDRVKRVRLQPEEALQVKADIARQVTNAFVAQELTRRVEAAVQENEQLVTAMRLAILAEIDEVRAVEVGLPQFLDKRYLVHNVLELIPNTVKLDMPPTSSQMRTLEALRNRDVFDKRMERASKTLKNKIEPFDMGDLHAHFVEDLDILQEWYGLRYQKRLDQMMVSVNKLTVDEKARFEASLAIDDEYVKDIVLDVSYDGYLSAQKVHLQYEIENDLREMQTLIGTSAKKSPGAGDWARRPENKVSRYDVEPQIRELRRSLSSLYTYRMNTAAARAEIETYGDVLVFDTLERVRMAFENVENDRYLRMLSLRPINTPVGAVALATEYITRLNLVRGKLFDLRKQHADDAEIRDELTRKIEWIDNRAESFNPQINASGETQINPFGDPQITRVLETLKKLPKGGRDLPPIP